MPTLLMKYPDYEQEGYDDNYELTRARLELDHVKMQRDAYAAALRKEVMAMFSEIIREEIIRQLSGRIR